jgi:uncharacterized protein (TIRG00374 family)
MPAPDVSRQERAEEPQRAPDGSPQVTTTAPAPSPETARPVAGTHLYRHRADVARLAFNIVVLAGLILLALLAPRGLRSASANLLQLVALLPRALVEGMVGVAQVAAIVVPIGAAAVLVWRRRFVPLVSSAAAAALAAGLMALLTGWFDDSVPADQLGFERFESWLIGRQFPSSTYLCAATAVLVAGGPWLTNRWRRAGWIFLATAVASRLLTATDVPMRIGMLLTLGAACGSLVLVILGAPRRRVDPAAIAAVLADIGLDDLDVRPVPTDDEIPTYTATGPGSAYVAKVLGRDQRDSDLLIHAWRGLTRRGLGDASPVASPRRAAEHQALALGLFRAAGVAAPEPIAVLETADDAAVVVTSAPTGTALADLPADEIDTSLLDDVWREVARLQGRRIAHRHLTPDRILVDGGRPTVVDAHYADIRASDQVLGADVAELLCSLGLLVGTDAAVAAAARQLTPEQLARAVPLVQPAVLTPATRRAYKGDKQALTELRDRLADVAGVEQVELAPVSRITVTGIVSLVGSLVLGYYLISLATDWQDIWAAFTEANLAYAIPIVGLTAGTYVAGAMSLIGAAAIDLPMLRTTAVMFGQSFLNRFTPANAGGMAMRLRYLQLNGLDTTVAGAAVGLTSIASGIVQVVFVVVFFIWGGTSDRFRSFSVPDVGTILVVVLVVGLVSSAALYSRWGRRIVLPHLHDAVGKVASTVRELAADPGRLGLLFGGATLTKLFFLTSFWLSVLAFGVTMSFPKAGALYMVANTVGSAVPSPGGVGGVEAALTAVLMGFGVDGATAAGIVLYFRVLTFWLPTLPGYGFLQYTQRKGIV